MGGDIVIDDNIRLLTHLLYGTTITSRLLFISVLTVITSNVLNGVIKATFIGINQHVYNYYY